MASVNSVLVEGYRGSVLAIIAALNEEEGIGPTIAELRQHVANVRVLVVDGNSYDRTVEVAKNCDADVVFQTGKGKGDAIAEAIRRADGDQEYAVLTDADYTYPAEFVPKMIRILEENPEVGMYAVAGSTRTFIWKRYVTCSILATGCWLSATTF